MHFTINNFLYHILSLFSLLILIIEIFCKIAIVLLFLHSYKSKKQLLINFIVNLNLQFLLFQDIIIYIKATSL